MDKPKKPRFESHLKVHLVRLKQNLFINPSDVMYYQKVLQYINPNCPESHFKLGVACEHRGKISKAIYHYQMASKGSSPYWNQAKQAVQRLTQQSKEKNTDRRAVLLFTRPFLFKTATLTLLIVIIILLFFILSHLLELSKLQQDTHTKLPSSQPVEVLPNTILPPQGGLDPLTLVSSNLVRTALQTYHKENGYFPPTIAQLMGDFPNNFLQFIPLEPVSGINRVVSAYDGDGGWVYDQFAIRLEEIFFPNVANVEVNIPFQPIEIWISKIGYELYLVNGEYIIAQIPVGLGQSDLTPEGEFMVSERVWQPRGINPDIYGIAGLAMAEHGIAIHGTFDESSIRSNQSLGCVRVSNEDMAEVFPFIPKGTMVRIAEDVFKLDGKKNLSLSFTSELVPPIFPSINQTSDTIIHWLG